MNYLGIDYATDLRQSNFYSVIPAKAGIHHEFGWILAFARMTIFTDLWKDQ